MIEYNLDRLVKKLEVTQNRRVTTTELSEHTGISRPVVTQMMRNQPRPELEMLQKILDWFKAQGMEVSATELFRDSEY